MTLVSNVCSACTLVLCLSPCLTFAQSDKLADKWEYGELHFYENAGSSDNPDHVFRSAVDWISGEGFVRGYGWQGMADKLNAPALKKDLLKITEKGTDKKELEGLHRLRLLNHLGFQGWELASYQRDERFDSHWIFKRRVPLKPEK